MNAFGLKMIEEGVIKWRIWCAFVTTLLSTRRGLTSTRERNYPRHFIALTTNRNTIKEFLFLKPI